MRLKLLMLVTILLLAGSSESRPQNYAPIEERRAEVGGNGWKPIQMRSEDISHAVLSNSRYIRVGGNNRLIYNNYNYDNIIPSFTSIRPNIRLNYSDSGKTRSIDDDSHNYEVGDKEIGKSYSQGRNDSKHEKSMRYISGRINTFGKKVMGEVTSRVIPIPISNHASQDDFSVQPRSQGERKIKEAENKSVFQGRRISSRNRNYVKIISHEHVPLRLNSKDRIKNLNKFVKNGTKIDKGKINVIKENLNSQMKTTNLSNKIDQNRPHKIKPMNLVMKEPFTQDPFKNVITPRPNSKIALNSHLKNWPNEGVQNMEDFYNYDKYTSFQDNTKKPSHHKIHKKPDTASANQYLTNNREPSMHSSTEEMIQWFKNPAFTTNQSHVIEEESGKPISNTFEPIYEDLEPNTPLKPMEESLVDDKLDNQDQFLKSPYYFSSPQFDSVINSLQDPILKRQPVYKPTAQVIQDTVVHILSPGSKKQNSTIAGSKNPPNKILQKNQTSGSPPNVHIMFMKDDMMNSSNYAETSVPSLKDECPTIMINSITKVNNKIQSKEGCTDLNIIINSHILNTNIFTSPATSSNVAAESQKYPDGTIAMDKYDVPQHTNNPQYTSAPQYINDPTIGPPYLNEPTVSSGTYNQNYYTPLQDNSYQPLKDTETPEILENTENSSFEIIQGTNIHIGPSSSNEPEFVNEVASPETEGTGNTVENGPETGEGSSTDFASEAVNKPAADAASDAGPASDVSQVEQSSSALETGPAEANDASGGSTLNIPRPNFPNLSGLTNLGGAESNGGGQLPDSTALFPAGGVDDNDDDYDDLDISPSSMMESITSLFSYFTSLNPLNYGLFSIAIAPFTAFAAGVLGVAAFLFPWAFPGTLDLARSSDVVTIRFIPSLEEVVKHSIYKYRNWNEWKRKRRKRRKR